MKKTVFGVLRKINSFGENDYAIIQYFKENYKCIGNGSSRRVYTINDHWVAKVAKNAIGKMQNSIEYDVYFHTADKSQLGVIHESCHNDDTVIFMRRYQKISQQSKKFKKHFEDTFCQNFNKLKNHEFKPMYKFMKYISSHKDEIITFIDVDITADLHRSNIGYDPKNKRIVIIDYGCSRECSKIYICKHHRYSKAMRKLINETNEHYQAYNLYDHEIFKS